MPKRRRPGSSRKALAPPRPAPVASEQRPKPDPRSVSYAPYQHPQRLSPSQKFSCAPVIAPYGPSLFDSHHSGAPSLLISSYITSLHLHLRIALGSKHSTCDPSRHWLKKYDMQRSATSERSPPDSIPLRLEYLTVCCPIGSLRNHPFITPQIPSFMLSASQVLRCRNPRS